MCTTRLRAVQKTRGKAWRYSEASAPVQKTRGKAWRYSEASAPAWRYSEASAPAASRHRLHRRLLLRGKGGASSLRADPETVRRSTKQCSRREGANCLRECSNERGRRAGRGDQRAEWAARVVSEPLAHRQQQVGTKGGHDHRARTVYDSTLDTA